MVVTQVVAVVVEVAVAITQNSRALRVSQKVKSLFKQQLVCLTDIVMLPVSFVVVFLCDFYFVFKF